MSIYFIVGAILLLVIEDISAQYYSGQFTQRIGNFARAPCQTGGCNQNYGVYYQNRQQQQSCPACSQQFTPYVFQQPLPQPLQAPPTLAPVIQPQSVESKPIPIPIPEAEICPPCPSISTQTVCPKLTCPELSCPGVEGTKATRYEEQHAVQNDDVESEQEVDPASLDHEMLAMKEQEKRYRHRVAAVRFSQRRRKRATVDIVSLKTKCNNDDLKKIMTQSISKNIVATKVAIAERAARELGGQFNVICTTGVFSYYVAARTFCEVSKKNVTCFVFRHDNIVNRHATLRSAPVPGDSSAEIGVRNVRQDKLPDEVPMQSKAELGVDKFHEAERLANVEDPKPIPIAKDLDVSTFKRDETDVIYKKAEPKKTAKVFRSSTPLKRKKRPRMNDGSAGTRSIKQTYDISI